MKKCIQCGEDFTPRGRQKLCRVCKDAMQQRKEVQATDERPAEAGPVRIIYGGAGVILR